MLEIAMRRQGGRLIPVDEIAADSLVRVPADRDVMVKITSPQNMKLLRFLWALASKVADACDHLHDRDDAMDELKIRTRHVKYITNPATGDVRIVPKSLTKLDGSGLSRLADRMVYVICRDILPGLDETILKSEIMKMVSGENSNSSHASVSTDPQAETKPATDVPPEVAGTPSELSEAAVTGSDGQGGGDDGSQEPSSSPAEAPSTLPENWQQTYLTAMSRVSDRPKSLVSRHAEALKLIGGSPDPDEKAWMTAVYRLTERRLAGQITKDECDAAIREIS